MKEEMRKKSKCDLEKNSGGILKFSWKRLLFGIEFLIAITGGVKGNAGPGKWPIIDLKYHADGEKIDNLCSRMTTHGITPSTAANVKDSIHKYQYKFLWTAWVKLPTGMVMKRYDYDSNYHSTVPTKEFQELAYTNGKSVNFFFKDTYPFIVNDLTKFNEGYDLENCYTYDDSVAANCNSAKLCSGHKFCAYRCPKTQSLTQNICNQDHTKRCKTVGTNSWFLIGADYTILEPSVGTCNIEFSILRATPTKSDSAYGTTNCNDYSTQPLRLHLAFGTNRGDPNSIIKEDTDEIKLQAGYETIIVKKRASAFIVLDKNELYITGRGNTGSDLEITLDDIKNYHQTLDFYTYLASGEPTLFGFFDFTRWDPSHLSLYATFYKSGTDNHKKFLFENYSTYGYPFHPDQNMPDEGPFTGGAEMFERIFDYSTLPLIDQDNGDFCATLAPTITIVRKADNTLNSDGSNKIILEGKFGFREPGFSGHKTFDYFITIVRVDASNVQVYLHLGETPQTYDTEEVTSSGTGDFKVDGALKGRLTYSSTWPGTGYLELMVQTTICPTDWEPSSTQRLVPMMISLTIKDSESPFEKISAKPIRGYVGNILGYRQESLPVKTIGMRMIVNTNSAKTNLGFYISNLGAFKGGSSPLMIDKITTDTSTYPDYTYWTNHFIQNHPFSLIGGSRTSPDGTKNPNDSIFLTRCTNDETLTFLKGDNSQCLVAPSPITGCLKYRADTTDPTKAVCERCDEANGYWIDKSNPDGVCVLKVENPGVEVNCDANTHNHYAEGECHSCIGVDNGCVCNSNQAKETNGTCTCSPSGCGICFESGGSNCQFCFPVNIFKEHPADTVNPLVCVEIAKINIENPGKGHDKTRSPPSLISCADGVECQFCASDATDCTRCTGTDPNDPAHYFSKDGDCVLRSTLTSRVGFGPDSAYELRVFACDSNNCATCYTNFQKCTLCDTSYYLHDKSSTVTGCTHQTEIPDGLGINEALKKLLPCIGSDCRNCALDYEDCAACLNELQQGLVTNEEFQGKKKCQTRDLDAPALQNQVNSANTFTVSESNFRSSISTIKLEFNLRCNKNAQSSAIRVKLFNADKTQEINIEYLRGRLVDDYKTLALEVKIKGNVENGVMVINFMNVISFYEENKPTNTLNIAEIEIKNINYFSLGDEKAVATAAKVGNTGLKITSILYYLVSTTTSLFLLKLFQMIDYLVFFNVDHPRNLKVFLSVMGSGPIEDIPNFFSFLADGKCLKVKEKFSDEGMTCQIFQSYGNYFMVILLLGCLKLISMALYHILDHFGKDPLWLRKFHYKFMGSRFWLDFFDAIQLDLYLNAMIALTSYKGGSGVAQFNYFFSIGIIIFSLTALFLLYRHINKYQKLTGYKELKREELDRLFALRIYSVDLAWIKFEYKDKNWYQKYHSMHNFIRDPVLAMCMVFLHDYPILQTLSSCFVMLFSAVMDSIHWPFREKPKNILLIVTGYMYVAINILFTIMATGDNKIRKKAQYIYLGFLIITLISLIIFADIGYATMEVYLKIKKWYQERKRKTKKTENEAKGKEEVNERDESEGKKANILNSNGGGSGSKIIILNIKNRLTEFQKNELKNYKKFSSSKKIEEERSSQLINSPKKGRLERKMKRGVTFKEIEEVQDNGREIDISSPTKNKSRRKMSFSPRKRSTSPRKSRLEKGDLKFRKGGVTVTRKRSGAGGFSSMLDE